jgi:hypothetical protein
MTHTSEWYDTQARNLLNQARSATTAGFERVKGEMRRLIASAVADSDDRAVNKSVPRKLRVGHCNERGGVHGVGKVQRVPSPNAHDEH